LYNIRPGNGAGPFLQPRSPHRAYVSGAWPDDLLDLVIIPTEEKHRAQDCADFRTISLVLHAYSTMVLKILTRRLDSTAESYFGKDQFGFRKGCGTVTHISGQQSTLNDVGFMADLLSFYETVKFSALTH